jgi:starvation-inducible DNA-binding protein
MKLSIGLNEQQREGTVKILTSLLADENVLYIKLRNFHWNVTGPQFNEFHQFFQNQYEDLEDVIDDVAERIRSLGHLATGSMTEFLKHTRLEETPGEMLTWQEMIGNLLGDNEVIIKSLRTDLRTCDETFNDMGTSDFLTGLMEKHEKMAWMLRSYITDEIFQENNKVYETYSH